MTQSGMAPFATKGGVTNPKFNGRKLRLGTFSTNLSGGCVISTMEGVLEADWPSVSRLAQLADEMEFEAIVPVGRWRGFGGETDFNGAGFECYSFAAGIGAQSRYPAVLVTSHVPSIHPVMAAKQAATVDHISRGRFALNIIAGWPALSRAHTHARRSWANAEGADNGAAISRGHPCARAARSVR